MTFLLLQAQHADVLYTFWAVAHLPQETAESKLKYKQNVAKLPEVSGRIQNVKEVRKYVYD